MNKKVILSITAILVGMLAITGSGLVAAKGVGGAAPASGAMLQGDPTPMPSRTFSETGMTVSGQFLQYWEQHGGLAQQGYPISREFEEKSALDGNYYTVQYFERAVFEWHGLNEPPFNVLLSQLGTFKYKERYGTQGAPNQRASTANPRLFPETGKTLGGRFREYWEQNGGLAQQGYPITDEFQEVSELNGQTYTVQYFERAVFELHPENQPPFDVLLSQLGSFQFRAKYANPAAGAQPIVSLRNSCLLGGSNGTRWVQPDVLGPTLKGSEQYNLYELTRAVGTAGSKALLNYGGPCPETHFVEVATTAANDDAAVALGGSWNALPRAPRVEGTQQEVYRQAVADILRSNGLTNSVPQITQILRVDLEGDGEAEVLITATQYAQPGLPGIKAGEYSIAFLRKVIAGQVRTTMLGAGFYPRDEEFAVAVTHTIPAVLDVNGDGVMEIVLHSNYYEGSSSKVFEVKGEEVQEVLACGCGS